MTTTYRCITEDGISGLIIAIGCDENQGGEDYNGVGKWCMFTFTEIPQPTQEISDFMIQNDFRNSILKVEDNQVVLRTLEELQASIVPSIK